MKKQTPTSPRSGKGLLCFSSLVLVAACIYAMHRNDRPTGPLNGSASTLEPRLIATKSTPLAEKTPPPHESQPIFEREKRIQGSPSIALRAPGNPAGEPAPFPSREMPSPVLLPMRISDRTQQPGFAWFEMMRPSYEADGTPQSLPPPPEVTDQPKPDSEALPQQAVSPAALDRPRDPRGPTASSTDTVWVWRLLAQLAVHDTNAVEMLVNRAAKNEIPDQAWPAIADTLVGESLQDGHLISVTSATLSAWTDGELNERLDLIGALLEVTTNKVARQAIQKAVVRLSDQLAQLRPNGVDIVATAAR